VAEKRFHTNFVTLEWNRSAIHDVPSSQQVSAGTHTERNNPMSAVHASRRTRFAAVGAITLVALTGVIAAGCGDDDKSDSDSKPSSASMQAKDSQADSGGMTKDDAMKSADAMKSEDTMDNSDSMDAAK
jgi:hypothetical protein